MNSIAASTYYRWLSIDCTSCTKMMHTYANITLDIKNMIMKSEIRIQKGKDKINYVYMHYFLGLPPTKILEIVE